MASAVPENLSREQYVYMAKLAEQAERYEEMARFMEKLVVGSTAPAPAPAELTVEERNLLSVAYKNVIGSLRAAWRIVSSIEQKEESRKNDDHVVLVAGYRSKIESELSAVCAGILQLLDSHLVPSAAQIPAYSNSHHPPSHPPHHHQQNSPSSHSVLSPFHVPHHPSQADQQTAPK